VNRPTNLIQVFRSLEAEEVGEVPLPELPHHALLDAKLLAQLYANLCTGRIGER
jgi:hypothetical protein